MCRFRELKYLQKQEQKQFQDLATKEHLALEQQERKFEQERQSLERTYENDLEVLSRQQRWVNFFAKKSTQSKIVFYFNEIIYKVIAFLNGESYKFG